MARKPRPHPFSIRLSPEERTEIASRAEQAGLSVGGYLRAAAFKARLPRRRAAPAPASD
jgi:hypothetical protein